MSSKKLKEKTAVFLQVRLNSDRLKEKAFLPLQSKSILQHIIDRLLLAKKLIDYIVVVCPEEDKIKIQKHLKSYSDIIIFGGETDNVLKRYYDANKLIEADIIIRATGDNPLVDIPHLIKALNFHIKIKNDYTIFKNLPLGTGIEVISSYALTETFKNADKKYQLEHVTPYIRENKERFKTIFLEPEKFFQRPDLRLTVDEENDYKLMDIIYHNLYKNKPIPLKEVLLFLDKNQKLLSINKDVKQIKVP